MYPSIAIRCGSAAVRAAARNAQGNERHDLARRKVRITVADPRTACVRCTRRTDLLTVGASSKNSVRKAG